MVVKRHSAMADNRGTAGEQEILRFKSGSKNIKSSPRIDSQAE